MVAVHDDAALLLHIEAGIVKHAANHHQLLVVDLQHVAVAQVGLNNLLAIEVATQVDVEDAQAVGRTSGDELLNGLFRLLTTLGKRPEADGAALFSHGLNLRRELQMVPCHVGGEGISGDTRLIELHVDRTRRVRHTGNEVLKAVLVERGQRLIA